MRFMGILCWFLMAGMLSPQTNVMAQDLQVLVLDALDGKPQANVKVEYFCTGTPHNSTPKTTFTNIEGLAKVSILCGDEQKIDIAVYPPNKKNNAV